MNATTDLLYPTLINLDRTFTSRKYRIEIEKLSLEELDKRIEELSSNKAEKDADRNEKLRLCLRFKNAYLINLPYFEVTEICKWEVPHTFRIDKQVIVFYFLNFRNEEDLELFKINTSPLAGNKEIIGVFIVKESSFGFEEMKKYSKHFGRLSNFILEIKSFQYNHLMSRNRLQHTLFKYATEPHSFPCTCVYDTIMTIHYGRSYAFGSYPENAGEPNFNLTDSVKLAVQRTGLLAKENLMLIIMIEFNGDLDEHFYNDLLSGNQDVYNFIDLLNEYGGCDGISIYCFISNYELDTSFRVSVLATDKSA